MQELVMKLSEVGEQNIYILTSPKYHCEIAGDGIEFVWGLIKKWYRNVVLSKKQTKDTFTECVKDCVAKISIEHVRKFAGKVRRYMLSYNNLNSNKLTYKSIEKFVKKTKTHCNMSDIEKGYVEKIWKESYAH